MKTIRRVSSEIWQKAANTLKHPDFLPGLADEIDEHFSSLFIVGNPAQHKVALLEIELLKQANTAPTSPESKRLKALMNSVELYEEYKASSGNDIMIEEPLKKCARCEKDLPHGNYYKSATKRDGMQHICKPCMNENDRKANERCTSQTGRFAHLK